MAFWGKTLRFTQQQGEVIRLGGGVNNSTTPFEIAKNEAVDSSNIASDSFPALSVRAGNTEQFNTSTVKIVKFNGAGVRDNEYIYIADGTTLKRWDGSVFQVVNTALGDAKMTIAELSTQAKTYTIYSNGIQIWAYDGSTSQQITEAPLGTLIAVDDDRVYILKDRELQYCASGNPFDWTTLSDAGQEVIAGMVGSETAIAAYNDIIVMWSDATMHLAYGDNADNLVIRNPMKVGCVSQNSVVEHRGLLYFMDYNAIKRFDGGFPVTISDKIEDYLKNINYGLKHLICSGARDDYLYISIPYGSSATTNNMTIRYDIENGTWYPSKDKGYLQFVSIGPDIYGVTTTGTIEKLEDGTTNSGAAIEWYHDTGILEAAPIKARKTVTQYWMCFDLPPGSTLEVSYSDSSYADDFESLATFDGDTDSQYDVVMIPTDVLQEVNKYRLRFSGAGPCSIHYLETLIRTKSR